MSEILLSMRDLSYRWPDDADNRPVIDGLSLDVHTDERVFLAGASGSGKSTLLALIGGLIAPDHGRIDFLGQRLDTLGRAARDRFRADHLGVVFQQFNLLPWISAVDNVRLGCRFSAARSRRAGRPAESARALLEAMGIASELQTRRAGRLSVGQQQRVAAARALIGQPDLLLADEPTSALDTDRRDEFLGLLFSQARAAGSAVLFVSHDRSLAARFDRVLELEALNHAGETS